MGSDPGVRGSGRVSISKTISFEETSEFCGKEEALRETLVRRNGAEKRPLRNNNISEEAEGREARKIRSRGFGRGLEKHRKGLHDTVSPQESK